MTLKRHIMAFLVPGLLFVLLVLLAKTTWFLNQPESLYIGFILDFSFTLPSIYFLMIRKTGIPNITVVPVFILATTVATYVVPAEHQFYLNHIKSLVIPIAELGALGFIIYKVRQINIEYRKQKRQQENFYEALKKAASQIFPKKISTFFAVEIATIYYGFFNWKNYKLKPNEYSYHKESGATALYLVIIGMIGIETATLHMLLINWSEIFTWILTVLSIYTGVQLLGFVRSMSKLPIELNHEELSLRYGLMANLNIHYDQIKSFEKSTKDLEEGSYVKKLSILGDLEAHNFIIHFKEETTFHSLYGIKKVCSGIALHLDKPDDFREALTQRIDR